jgi:DNA-binding YbaB/EbfC family protein
MDMMEMMKQAKAVSEKMKSAQEAVEHIRVTGFAGLDEDKVSVEMDGRHQMLGVSIPAHLMGKNDADSVAFLQDLIAAATNDAVQKVAKETKDRMGNVMGGLQLPPGFKLPF